MHLLLNSDIITFLYTHTYVLLIYYSFKSKKLNYLTVPKIDSVFNDKETLVRKTLNLKSIKHGL